MSASAVIGYPIYVGTDLLRPAALIAELADQAAVNAKHAVEDALGSTPYRVVV
jgi:hypothetical protein